MSREILIPTPEPTLVNSPPFARPVSSLDSGTVRNASLDTGRCHKTKPLAANYIEKSERIIHPNRLVVCVYVQIHIASPKTERILGKESSRLRIIIPCPVVIQARRVFLSAGVLQGVRGGAGAGEVLAEGGVGVGLLDRAGVVGERRDRGHAVVEVRVELPLTVVVVVIGRDDLVYHRAAQEGGLRLAATVVDRLDVLAVEKVERLFAVRLLRDAVVVGVVLVAGDLTSRVQLDEPVLRVVDVALQQGPLAAPASRSGFRSRRR